MLASKLLSACGGEETLFSDDVFSAYLRTGTGADVTVTTGIDMTKGYMLWSKGRSGATDHAICHSARGVTLDLVSNSTAAQTTQATGLKSVSATGHTVGALAKMNTSSATYVDWTFRNADKFYGHSVVTKSSGSNATVSFANLGTLGMVRVKRTDSTGSWYIWHRSLSAGQLLIGETTAAASTLGHVTVSGTTVTLVNAVIADGTYLVEAFAHDPSADGIIQCGSLTATGDDTVTLGWEPQFLLVKRSSLAEAWYMVDTMRGWSHESDDKYLQPNASAAESGNPTGNPTATGFRLQSAFGTYIYLAIRRPNKPPTTGTQVYNAIARTGTGVAATVTGVGFAPDLIHTQGRDVANSGFCDRLRGVNKLLNSITTGAEIASTNSIQSMDVGGVTFGTDADTNWFNFSTRPYINHFFKRATGVFDVVCYTGTGAARTVPHSFGVAPELMIVKARSGATQWEIYSSGIANTEKLVLNSTAAKTTDATAWNSTSPAASVFTVGTGANVNANGTTYVAYLFATKAGISKVGSYTGNGSSQTIDCGFTTGARFVLIKRTDSTGDWKVIDTTRGLIAGNDPTLALNTAAAEVTGTDCLDPASLGFVVNQEATNNLNVNAATYIFLALS